MLGSALGTASLVAQTNVYSINAVGYINLTLQPGFNIIACQLQTGSNTVAGLFNNQTGEFTTEAWFSNIALLAAAFIVRTLLDSASGSAANGWDVPMPGDYPESW